MPSKLIEMIESQPHAIEAVAGLDLTGHVKTLEGADRLRLIGTGTSYHAALLGAYLLRAGGIDAEAILSSELAHWRPEPGRNDATIVISHTGETAYARAARAAALRTGRRLVTITGTAAGWGEALQTGTQEQAETYTVSYTAALATLYRIAHALTGIGAGAGALRDVATRVREVIATPGLDGIAPPPRALALIGPGIWGVTAREGALKLRESAHVLAEGFAAEQLLHGYAVPYHAGDTLIALQPAADPDGLTAALLDAARREAIDTHTLSDPDVGADPADTFLAQIPATVRLQLLAARVVAAHGTDPDTVITGAWADPALWSAGAPLD